MTSASSDDAGAADGKAALMDIGVVVSVNRGADVGAGIAGFGIAGIAGDASGGASGGIDVASVGGAITEGGAFVAVVLAIGVGRLVGGGIGPGGAVMFRGGSGGTGGILAIG